MSNAPMKRGEWKARRMMKIMDEAGVVAEPVWRKGEGWGLRFVNSTSYSAEQKSVAADSIMFGIAYPRCFATMCRLLQEKEAAQ